MRDKLFHFLIALLVVLGLAACIALQHKRITSLAGERDRYARNTDALMTEVEQYKVRDSLNVARTESLELTIKEYQKYRADDAALIKQLKTKNRDLQLVVTSQSQSIYELSTIPKDTVIIRDSVPIPAMMLHCGDDWYDFDGVLANGKFEGNMVTRDSLLLAESVRYKRFLGFLWKTKKVKDRMMDVVSKNPHCVIQDVELVTIEAR